MPVFQEHGAVRLCDLSPLQLAYIGDSVYDLLVRSSLLQSSCRLQRMHLDAVSRVRASAQAKTLSFLLPHLNEDEADYVRKGRNANGHHQAPRSASTADYAAATGLECLFGYLYVTGQEQRLHALYELGSQLSAEAAS